MSANLRGQPAGQEPTTTHVANISRFMTLLLDRVLGFCSLTTDFFNIPPSRVVELGARIEF
jgi:hypothetical protein